MIFPYYDFGGANKEPIFLCLIGLIILMEYQPLWLFNTKTIFAEE